MKRLFALALSLLIVGTPTVAGAEISYRDASANIAAHTESLAAVTSENADLEAQAQELFAQAQEQVRIEEEAARKAEEERLKAEEEARKAEEYRKAAAARRANVAERIAAATEGTGNYLSAWQSEYPSVIGYIHSPGTAISYPIAYDGTDYYLNHNLDGVECVEGAIYLEKVNSSDFSDGNSILYGHHMKNGSMFASICYYKNSSYYYDHPYMFLYTNGGNYRLDVVSGFPCPGNDRVFRTGFDSEHISDFMSRSTFTSAISNPTGPFVSLVTCSYEGYNYRYVLICQMTAI